MTNVRMRASFRLACLAAVVGLVIPPVQAQGAPPQSGRFAEPLSAPAGVSADRETVPVPSAGDAADDPALWRNPNDPSSSLVIGNNKLGGLEVYGLDGSLRQRITTATSFWGNVDVRQGTSLGGRTRDLVAAYNAGLRIFTVDPVTLRLTQTTEGNAPISTGGGEGLCLYQSRTTGDSYAFVITISGRVRQYRITDDDSDGLLSASLVREFLVGSESEGCVVDDDADALYISEEDVGLWRYGAQPNAGSTRTLVDSVTPSGRIAPDAEGVTIVNLPEGEGYVMVSAQNTADPLNSYFVAYRRSTGAFVGTFRVTAGERADGCSRTDGITALAAELGPDFPHGVFVCQDDKNTEPGGSGNQNFKLVRLERVLGLWADPPPPPPPGPNAFVGAASANGNRTVHAIRLPASVQPGDTLVAHLSWNTSATITQQSPGWTDVASVGDSSLRATAWVRTATAADVGGTLTITLSRISKADITVAAYRGVRFGVTQGGFSTNEGAYHTTPLVSTTEPAWVVSYWADKSSYGTALTPPAGQELRTSSTGTGNGRITAALTDFGTTIPAGIVGGLTAEGTPYSSRTATFTTILIA
jgi:3-phytase